MNKQTATLRPLHSWIIACHHAVRCLVVLGGLLFLCHDMVAGDWPQWRGPQRDARIVEFESPGAWPKQLRGEWQVEVGEGHSSPVVAEGRVVVHSRQLDDEHVRCIALENGAVAWHDRYPAKGAVHPAGAAHGLGPKSTPAIANGRVYTLGIGSILTCYDLKSGRVHWRKDFRGKFVQPAPSCGTSMSPLLVDGLCVVHVGVDSKGELIALDAETGQSRWSYDGDGPGYSSPIVITHDGEQQIVTLASQCVVGVALKTGELRWRYPFRTTNTQNIATPVYYGGSLIVGGIGQPLMALRLSTGTGGVVEEAWLKGEVPLHMSSPVLVGDHLFGLSHRKSGHLFCLDAATGKTHWQTEGRFGENAALLHAGSLLIVLQNSGQLVFARTDASGYQPIASYRVSSRPTWAHPAVAGQRILVKDTQTLLCWSLAP